MQSSATFPEKTYNFLYKKVAFISQNTNYWK